ncbi:hypothetical protein [Acinetobacter parvus]|uniref:hypothetical protein n=1 Tax=Acinetobacter parvus TaxID=134533 RepID=UPI0021CDE592|nr:hypothetical protein [Acinetobacter parvus]MCU4394524.1 hypothetical protein [Acinetobacter parvus]MCU4613716.1 hypothetical protein [Acinetobacter parvus]
MNICIGGDLDGRVIVLDKLSFNAKEVNKTKSTKYIKQMYVIDGDVYYFWRDAELKLWEVTQRIEILLAKAKRKSI